MKNTPLFSAIIAAAFLPGLASAALLVGWQDFPTPPVGGLTPNDKLLPTYNGFINGASSGVSGNSGTGSDISGSAKTHYNGTAVPTANNNGFIAVGTSSPVTVEFLPTPSGNISLDALVFDVLSLSSDNTETRTLKVSYTTSNVPNAPLTFLDEMIIPVFSSVANYTAESFNLEAISGFSTYLKLQFTVGGGGALLDNIAIKGEISPIPETGAALGMLGLISAGSLFRRRSAK